MDSVPHVRPNIAIDLQNVVVDYPIYTKRGRSLKSHIAKAVGGNINNDSDDRIVVRAIDEVSLSFRPGDRVGLIGANGSGKSTLLRVVAGIMEPSYGSVRIAGRVASLIDLSMGMDSEATGYENIIMRGVFLGRTFTEARATIPDIEKFTELGEYLSFPIRTYSSGMGVRLSFAISTAVECDILVLDEIIGAGDAAFHHKADARMHSLIHSTDIVVIATHDLSMTRQLCNRALFLSKGRIVVDGSVEDAIRSYNESIESTE